VHLSYVVKFPPKRPQGQTQFNQASRQTADFVPQACSGPNGTGTCVDLNVASSNPTGPAINPAACTNVNNPKSLVLNPDNDCVSFQYVLPCMLRVCSEH
jgi:hypothetical protein